MTKTFHDPCPICGALVTHTTGLEFTCPACRNKLILGSTDATRHSLDEIETLAAGRELIPDLAGVFRFELHPIGTTICAVCRQIYASSFECCPKLVDLALSSYQQDTEEHGQSTDNAIAKFLRDNERVVANNVQLRAVEAKHHKLDETAFARIRSTLKDLGKLALIEDL